MPLAYHAVVWSLGWSFCILGSASCWRAGRKRDQLPSKCRRPGPASMQAQLSESVILWAQGPAGCSSATSVPVRLMGRLLCGVSLFLLPSLSCKTKLEEQSLLDVQDWAQHDSFSFVSDRLGWGAKGTVHLITLGTCNMTTRHALVLWGCVLKQPFWGYPHKICLESHSGWHLN